MGAPNVYLRGGRPAIMVETTAVATVEQWHWRGRIVSSDGGDAYGTANWFRLENTGANPLLLSFTQEDLLAGIVVTIAAGAVFEAPLEIARFWTQSTLGTTFTALATIRRGG